MVSHLLLLALSLPAPAKEPLAGSTTVIPRPLLGHAVFDLRAGMDLASDGSGLPGRPYLCGELRPVSRLGIEACGSGSGILHQGDEPDLAHFRLHLDALRRDFGEVEGALVAGMGFAELQNGPDAPGFDFGQPDRPSPVEAAGPEASLSARARYWMHERVYLVTDLNAGAAHIPGAPAVSGTDGPVVVFTALSAGVGF